MWVNAESCGTVCWGPLGGSWWTGYSISPPRQQPGVGDFWWELLQSSSPLFCRTGWELVITLGDVFLVLAHLVELRAPPPVALGYWVDLSRDPCQHPLRKSPSWASKRKKGLPFPSPCSHTLAYSRIPLLNWWGWTQSKNLCWTTKPQVRRLFGVHYFLCSLDVDRVQFSSVAQSCPTLCDPMDYSMPGPPCPSPTPRVHTNPWPLSWWCHPTVSSSVIPFSSCPQSFPASGSFQMSQLFASGGQRIGVSASASVLPMNTQDCSPLGWTAWISCSPRDSQESSPTPQFKSLSPRDSQESSPTPQFKSLNSLALSFLYSPTLTSIHDYWKNRSLDGPLLAK